MILVTCVETIEQANAERSLLAQVLEEDETRFGHGCSPDSDQTGVVITLALSSCVIEETGPDTQIDLDDRIITVSQAGVVSAAHCVAPAGEASSPGFSYFGKDGRKDGDPTPGASVCRERTGSPSERAPGQR